MQKIGGVKFRVKIQIWGKLAIERCCEANRGIPMKTSHSVFWICLCGHH